MELHKLTSQKAYELLKKKEISSEELTKAFLDRIKKVDNKIKAYITLNEKEALENSRKLDREGSFDRPLSGIPMAIKDNICTKGLKTTCASKMLEDFVPPYDATCVEKLKDDGGVILGKTNLDEFAMGSTTKNSAFFETSNPWDDSKVSGGSSGGSAAAVAADECIFALGSDTGGSVRQPASYCGVVGLKPTYGRVSRFGLAAYASSLDTIGIFTKNVADCAQVLTSISGQDNRDATSFDLKVCDFMKTLTSDIKDIRIGIVDNYFDENVESNVKEKVLDAVKALEDQGAVCENITFSYADYAPLAYYVIASAEASSNMARYDGIRYGHRAKNYDDLVSLYKNSRGEGFGSIVKSRVILGTFLSNFDEENYYLKAQKVRTLIINELREIFGKYDLLLTPTTPTVAIDKNDTDLENIYATDKHMVVANLAGLPAISVPCGFSKGLPVGLQLVGRPFDELQVLQAAYVFEKATGFKKNPDIEEE